MTEWPPTPSDVVDKDALPVESRVTVPRLVEPSRKLTEPVAVPVPLAGVTVAVKVIAAPLTAVKGDAASDVADAMGTLVAVMEIAADVLDAYAVLP